MLQGEIKMVDRSCVDHCSACAIQFTTSDLFRKYFSVYHVSGQCLLVAMFEQGYCKRFSGSSFFHDCLNPTFFPLNPLNLPLVYLLFPASVNYFFFFCFCFSLAISPLPLTSVVNVCLRGTSRGSQPPRPDCDVTNGSEGVVRAFDDGSMIKQRVPFSGSLPNKTSLCVTNRSNVCLWVPRATNELSRQQVHRNIAAIPCSQIHPEILQVVAFRLHSNVGEESFSLLYKSDCSSTLCVCPVCGYLHISSRFCVPVCLPTNLHV